MDGSLIVVDMRGPKIILSHETNNKKIKHKRQSIHGRTHGGEGPSSPSSGPDTVKSLTWTISPLDKGKSFFMSHNHHVDCSILRSPAECTPNRRLPVRIRRDIYARSFWESSVLEYCR